ncbi:MAG: hypothetical protein HZA60_08625 [Deltaproteobacteria bacterium]|nr:hypothetical protein [Deltaproteobacteria bacterium]
MEIVPGEGTRGTTFRLAAQGFSLEEAGIEWLVNGEPGGAKNEKSLNAADLKKGDSVQARVSAGGVVLLSPAAAIRNSPPGIRSVRFVPEIFRPGDTLGVEVVAADADGDAVTFAYAWELNGKPAGSGSRLGSALRRYDAVSVTITPSDGEGRGRPATLRREIRNAPPVIEGERNARFDGDLFTCRVHASDPDGDALAYRLKTAPPGMTIDGASGKIRWAALPEVRGKIPVVVSVSDGNGGEATYAFTIELK